MSQQDIDSFVDVFILYFNPDQLPIKPVLFLNEVNECSSLNQTAVIISSVLCGDSASEQFEWDHEWRNVSDQQKESVFLILFIQTGIKRQYGHVLASGKSHNNAANEPQTVCRIYPAKQIMLCAQKDQSNITHSFFYLQRINTACLWSVSVIQLLK